jgi:hypothetical protein
MTTDTEDRSTWPRNDKRIRRVELLWLIERNGGPRDLDLRGAIFLGDGQSEFSKDNPIDLSPEALAPLVAAYKQKQEHGGSEPPWLDIRGRFTLGGARLQGADLSRAQLQGADLSCAQLEKADLSGVQLQGAFIVYAQLQGADLGFGRLQGADLSYAELQGACLSEAELGGAHFTGAQLQRANLRYARLEGAVFRGAQLQEAFLTGARLQGAVLIAARLQRVDMSIVESPVGVHWAHAFLEYTRIDRRHLGQSIGDEDEARRHGSVKLDDKLLKARAYRDASEAYLLLKNNFNQIGRYEDASWAYVKEQQMEKMAYYWEWRAWGQREKMYASWGWRSSRWKGARRAWGSLWKVWRAWGSFWPWLRNWAYELATGYGERVYMPILWAIVVIAVFAGIYAVAGNIASGDVGSLQGQTTHSPVTALVHSISAFATIGFNTLEPQGSFARFLTAVEAMFGVGLFALFIFTLGNRMSRS